jgi:hypothetical protein
MVNRVQGDPASQLHERHDASDFESKDAGQVGAVTAESVKRISQRLLLQLTTPGGEKLSVEWIRQPDVFGDALASFT